MKIIIKYTALYLLLAVAAGCSGFLDEFPDGSIPQDGAIENMSDIEKSLIAVYSSAKSSRIFSGGGVLYPEIQTDYVQAIVGFSGAAAYFYQWGITAQIDELASVWGGYWAMISRANIIIANEKNANPRTEEDTLRLKSIVSEAHMARALAYSEMAKLWCDPYGKKLGGTSADPKTQLGLQVWDNFGVGTPGRTNMYDYYQNILTEIELAKEGITRNGVDDIYFSIGSVYALETRVHVAMGNWDEAIKSASYVIDSCNYSLLNAIKEEGQTMSDYERMWLNDEGAEIIWKVKFTKEFPGGALGTLFYSSKDGKIFQPEYIPARWVLDLYQKKEDQRYNVFFQEEKTGYPHGLEWPLLKKYPGNPALRTGVNSNYINMPKVFRLSEIYLLRAEAYLESGEEGKARTDLETLIKKRSTRMYDLSDVKKALREERVRELYMEGHRLSDLKRWGLGFERKAQLHTVAPTNSLKKEATDLFFTWPIPSHELDVPGSQMQGNPSNFR